MNLFIKSKVFMFYFRYFRKMYFFCEFEIEKWFANYKQIK